MLFHMNSIGFKSGEYTGRKIIVIFSSFATSFTFCFYEKQNYLLLLSTSCWDYSLLFYAKNRSHLLSLKILWKNTHFFHLLNKIQRNLSFLSWLYSFLPLFFRMTINEWCLYLYVEMIRLKNQLSHFLCSLFLLLFFF